MLKVQNLYLNGPRGQVPVGIYCNDALTGDERSNLYYVVDFKQFVSCGYAIGLELSNENELYNNSLRNAYVNVKFSPTEFSCVSGNGSITLGREREFPSGTGREQFGKYCLQPNGFQFPNFGDVHQGIQTSTGKPAIE